MGIHYWILKSCGQGATPANDGEFTFFTPLQILNMLRLSFRFRFIARNSRLTYPAHSSAPPVVCHRRLASGGMTAYFTTATSSAAAAIPEGNLLT